jgi:hypothetical protein
LFSKAKTTLSGTEDLEVESINDAQAAGTTGDTLHGTSYSSAYKPTKIRLSDIRSCSYVVPSIRSNVDLCDQHEQGTLDTSPIPILNQRRQRLVDPDT